MRRLRLGRIAPLLLLAGSAILSHSKSRRRADGYPFQDGPADDTGGLLHTMYEVKMSGSYDQSKGGQWASTAAERLPFEEQSSR